MREVFGSCVLAIWLAGCGGADPFGRVPVTGTVSLDGAPVPYADILFEGPPDANNQCAKSMIRMRDGKFELKAAQGPQVGKNTVQMSLYDAAPQVVEVNGRTDEKLGKHLGSWSGTFDVEADKPLVFDLKKADLK